MIKLYVEGIVGIDDKYKSMETVYTNCIELGLEVPQGVLDYFGD